MLCVWKHTPAHLYTQSEPLALAFTILSQKGFEVKWQIASVATTGLWYPDRPGPPLIPQHLVHRAHTTEQWPLSHYTVLFIAQCLSPVHLYHTVHVGQQPLCTEVPNLNLKPCYKCCLLDHLNEGEHYFFIWMHDTINASRIIPLMFHCGDGSFNVMLAAAPKIPGAIGINDAWTQKLECCLF